MYIPQERTLAWLAKNGEQKPVTFPLKQIVAGSDDAQVSLRKGQSKCRTGFRS